jgi:hypothetical protein
MTDGIPPISSSWGQANLDSLSVFFFQLNACGRSSYATSSLTKRFGCRLQLFLALARAVILWSESRGTHDHILLSLSRDSTNLEG